MLQVKTMRFIIVEPDGIARGAVKISRHWQPRSEGRFAVAELEPEIRRAFRDVRQQQVIIIFRAEEPERIGVRVHRRTHGDGEEKTAKPQQQKPAGGAAKRR